MMLVVGLGNPGRKYARTRHNVGFDVIAQLCDRWGASVVGRKLFGALVSEGAHGEDAAMLARPQQYMNRSGQPVASIMGHLKLPAERVVVVHDDMGLPPGTVRLRGGGGHGGHNGLRDLIAHIGRDFLRVRVGIGRPNEGVDPADFVLGKWTESEQTWLPDAINTGSSAVEVILSEGLIAAMNRFNVREKPAKAAGHGVNFKNIKSNNPVPDSGALE
jgi:PTH1 family peptidyl-tRNA hydrolase